MCSKRHIPSIFSLTILVSFVSTWQPQDAKIKIKEDSWGVMFSAAPVQPLGEGVSLFGACWGSGIITPGGHWEVSG